LDGLRFEIGKEGRFVAGGMRGVDRYQSIVNSCIGGMELVNYEEEVADRLILVDG